MEKSGNKVYLASNSYCKVGKITPKKHIKEDKLIPETDFKTANIEKYDGVLYKKKL
ncbi:hypothetical protein ACM55G_07945 [Flavobacterium sp. LB3P122]|uniref:hypothetical protein n=1 Tax=Flavobacterium algoriphilum TaxID=3398738 RepID=UPI003A850FAF